MAAAGSSTVVCLLGLTGCHSYPPPTPLDQLTAQQTRGHEVFEQHCSLCHYDRSDGSLHGPSLLSMYKKPYLHSGAPANDDRVTETILHGHNLMPAQPNMDPEDLNDLLAYLHTL
ncbi:c-type cytochrome [Granulicella sp. 5B5]|nr:c-type cytochrome [Granulicella sp. 5B5]